MKPILKLRKKQPECWAVVVAAGSSRRMDGVDKLTAELGDSPLLLWSLRAMDACERITGVVLVVQAERIDEFAALTSGLLKLRQIVAGGASRTESVSAGLAALPASVQLAAIHDAARPLVTPELIERTVRAAAKDGAAAPGLPVKDTIHRVNGDVTVEAMPRAELTAIQTPQCFDRDLLVGALHQAARDGAELTDECAALQRLGMRVRVVQGEERNFKVTTPLDLELARLIVRQETP